ncbi:hypothetical protein BDV19DRAFT_393369 [Aspergillus venezuelensis]
MAEIATLLTDNSNALHALNNAARLSPGETVFVHAEGSAFDSGLATIAFAKKLGGVVYATFSSDAQRQYLIETHKLPVSHVLDDADGDSLVSNVLGATGGRGVNVVVQPAAGSPNLRQASQACLATFGLLVEVQEAVTSVDLVEMFFAEDDFTAMRSNPV